MIGIVFFIAIVVLPCIISMWILFEKAGEPGWASIIPIYSTIVLVRIIRKPGYWIALMLIPYVNIIWGIWGLNLFVKAFGKDVGFTIGCIFLPFIFLPLLAANGNYVHGPQIATGNSNILDQGI